MSEKSWIEQAIERAVFQALEAEIPPLRHTLVRRVVEEIQPQLEGKIEGGALSNPESSPVNLLKAISAVHAGATQREILRALLDNAVRYCRRAALFVIKSGAATGWQGRAFANFEEIKDFNLDVSTGVAARALQSRMAFTGNAAELDPKFVSKFGNPADHRVMLLPLVLKDRVAALIYADAGSEAGGEMDCAALELLVVTTGAWLEVVSLRKGPHKDSAEGPSLDKSAISEKPAASSPAVSAPAVSPSDPFASHSPTHAAHTAPWPVAQPVATASAAEVTSIAQTASVESSASSGGSASAAAVAPAADPLAAMPVEDAEVHRKAQRFARLLVDEIKLYNQAKVAEGRNNADLYDRLKDDIEKSLATYQKRYGSTAAASADYFNQELVRSLAEDDAALMGANFQR